MNLYLVQVVAVDNLSNCAAEPTGGWRAGTSPGHTNCPESLVRVQRLAGRSCSFHKVTWSPSLSTQQATASPLQVDLLDKPALREVFNRHPEVSCVIHFAAFKVTRVGPPGPF